MEPLFFEDYVLREDVETEIKQGLGKDGKGKLPEDFWETYSAFANTQGGVVFLGVAEKEGGGFEILGMENPRKVVEELLSLCKDFQKVSINLLSESSVRSYPLKNGKWALEINIPQAPSQTRPVFINGKPFGGTYRRQDSADLHCTEDEVRRMMAEREE